MRRDNNEILLARAHHVLDHHQLVLDVRQGRILVRARRTHGRKYELDLYGNGYGSVHLK